MAASGDGRRGILNDGDRAEALWARGREVSPGEWTRAQRVPMFGVEKNAELHLVAFVRLPSLKPPGTELFWFPSNTYEVVVMLIVLSALLVVPILSTGCIVAFKRVRRHHSRLLAWLSTSRCEGPRIHSMSRSRAVLPCITCQIQ